MIDVIFTAECTRFVIAVVFFWQEWCELPTGALAHFWKFREEINQNSSKNKEDCVRHLEARCNNCNN